MAKERISSNVERQTRLRVKKAAEALGLSQNPNSLSKPLKPILINSISGFRHTRHADNAIALKAKMEEAQANLTAAEAKIQALENRGLLARLFNRPPTI